jgi:hypothetical protein
MKWATKLVGHVPLVMSAPPGVMLHQAVESQSPGFAGGGYDIPWPLSSSPGFASPLAAFFPPGLACCTGKTRINPLP